MICIVSENPEYHDILKTIWLCIETSNSEYLQLRTQKAGIVAQLGVFIPQLNYFDFFLERMTVAVVGLGWGLSAIEFGKKIKTIGLIFLPTKYLTLRQV